MMTFLDFFAGVGGFRRGMELAGHKCVGFCEVDKYAVASYTSMHLITDEQREYLNTLDFKKRQKEILKEEYRNGEWYCDDIRRLRADDVPRADVRNIWKKVMVSDTLFSMMSQNMQIQSAHAITRTVVKFLLTREKEKNLVNSHQKNVSDFRDGQMTTLRKLSL